MPLSGALQSLGCPIINKGKTPLNGQSTATAKSGTPTNPLNNKEAATGKSDGVPTYVGITNTLSSPIRIWESLPAVPIELVTNIQKGEYVDMAELLKDNNEITRRKDSQEGSLGGNKATRWEIPDLVSWVQCFGVYAAVLANRFPKRGRSCGHIRH